MSDELIKSLNSRVAELQGQVTTLSGEAAKYRKGKAKLRQEFDAALAEHAKVVADRDALTAKLAAAPGELRTENDRLTGELRKRDHRDLWRGAIGETLSEKVGVDDVWGKLDYKADGDPPSAERITELVKTARETAPYLFKPADAGKTASDEAKTRAALNGAAGSGRGILDNGVGKVEFSRADLANPRISMQPAYQARMRAAQKDGTFQVTE